MALITAHEFLRETEGILCGDHRIFSQNVGDHHIFIMLDDTADNGQIPEKLIDRTQQHDAGCVEGAGCLVDVQEPVGTDVRIKPSFQKIPTSSDENDIFHKNREQCKNDDHRKDGHRFGDLAAEQDLVNASENAEAKGSGCSDLVDDD